ncbi:lysine N(6)-hydroxylase/L-ornithine N(5)-oxygenase family protein [Bradyrhizobium sp. CCGUVB4N]|nr:lysine N(6)-hydroxylase/L-ornithine N(5)-oxygenase family protein [Bradyrhizobium sp. CCGUVB4N]
MDTLDVIGVGTGPFNLSLAALIEPTRLRALFLEKREAFCWHPGRALPNSRLQVSPFKDCVTLVSPTSPYSFLNCLAQNGRLYSFINKRSHSARHGLSAAHSPLFSVAPGQRAHGGQSDQQSSRTAVLSRSIWATPGRLRGCRRCRAER